MNRCFMLTGILLVFVVLIGSVTGKLYGISGKNQLVQIDAATSKMTVISSASLNDDLMAEELSTIDSTKGIYYIMAQDINTGKVLLLGLSTSTGQIAANVTLPIPPEALVGVGQTCDYDSSTGEVLISGLFGQNIHKIFRVDPNTGSIKPVMQIEGISVLGGVNGYDAKNKLLWVELGKNNTLFIYGIDVMSGKVVHQIENTANMETMDFDPKTELMWGIGLRIYPNNTSARTLVTLDGETGTFKEISELLGYFIIESDLSAIDIENRILYSILQPNGPIQTTPFQLVGVDMTTGKVKTSPKFCDAKEICLWSMEFQNQSK